MDPQIDAGKSDQPGPDEKDWSDNRIKSTDNGGHQKSARRMSRLSGKLIRRVLKTGLYLIMDFQHAVEAGLF
jgi:hypothetical protein